MDRDGSFCESFRKLLADAGVEPIRLPSRSPDLIALRTALSFVEIRMRGANDLFRRAFVAQRCEIILGELSPRAKSAGVE